MKQSDLTPIALVNVRAFIEANPERSFLGYATPAEIERLEVGEAVSVMPLGKRVSWFVEIESRRGDYFTGVVIYGDRLEYGPRIAFHACNIAAVGIYDQ
jgi:hypothetical protein